MMHRLQSYVVFFLIAFAIFSWCASYVMDSAGTFWQKTTPSPGTSVFPSKPTQAALPTTTSIPTTVRDQHWKAQTLLIESKAAQRDAVRSLERWNEEIEPLRNSSDGEVVAANKKLLDKLAFVLNRQRMNASELEVIGEKIKSLTELLEKEASQPKPNPLPLQAMADIGEIHTQTQAAQKDWDDSLRDARAVVLKAQLEASREERTSLQQKLDELQAQQVVDRLEKEMEVAATAPAISPTRGSTQPQASAPTTAIPTVDPQLRAEALSPRVKSALAVFLKPRNLQPRAGVGFVSMQTTFDNKPMSFSRIEGLGALEQSTEGLAMLARIGANQKLGELRWNKSWTPNYWSEGDTNFLKTRQEMLIKYGPILVEEGLLSP